MRQTPSSLMMSFVIVVITVFTMLGTATIGIMALAHISEPQAGPFATFADVFPGQPEDALKERGFLCHEHVYDYSEGPELLCTLRPATGAFSSIAVMIWGRDIHQITFGLREPMQVGDLKTFLKIRGFRAIPHALFFSWHGNFGSASMIADSKKFSWFRRVWQVAITDTSLM